MKILVLDVLLAYFKVYSRNFPTSEIKYEMPRIRENAKLTMALVQVVLLFS